MKKQNGCGNVAAYERKRFLKDSLKIAGCITQPGMEWVAEWIRPKLPGVQISPVASGDPFTWL